MELGEQALETAETLLTAAGQISFAAGVLRGERHTIFEHNTASWIMLDSIERAQIAISKLTGHISNEHNVDLSDLDMPHTRGGEG
jgi:hypothetical protein